MFALSIKEDLVFSARTTEVQNINACTHSYKGTLNNAHSGKGRHSAPVKNYSQTRKCMVKHGDIVELDVNHVKHRFLIHCVCPCKNYIPKCS